MSNNRTREHDMKLFIYVSVFLFISSSSLLSAARAPWVQEKMDNEALDNYVKEHPEISSMIKKIDYSNHIIYLDDECKLIFQHQTNIFPILFGGVAPAGLMEFSYKECDEDKLIDGFIE